MGFEGEGRSFSNDNIRTDRPRGERIRHLPTPAEILFQELTHLIEKDYAVTHSKQFRELFLTTFLVVLLERYPFMDSVAFLRPRRTVGPERGIQVRAAGSQR